MFKTVAIIATITVVILLFIMLKDTQKTNNTDEASTMPVIVIETTVGNIDVELDRAHAPITVDNFLNYTSRGHYDGTIFHRVIKDFMIQGGGFLPDASQKQTNAPIKLESSNGLKNKAGTIAMARTSVPDSATSQFFINTVDNAFLDYAPGNPGYAVFGKVVSGMDVVKKIEAVRTISKDAYADWPAQDVVIKKVYLKK